MQLHDLFTDSFVNYNLGKYKIMIIILKIIYENQVKFFFIDISSCILYILGLKIKRIAHYPML